MIRNAVRRLAVVACGLALLASLGCVVAADALNPAFFAGLGFDPATIFPSTGVVIIAFTNYTGSTATFYAFESPRARDLTGARNFFLDVDPGQTRNEVIECPVGVLSPGSLGEDFSVQSRAATVLVPGTDVAYNGSPLISGQDFTCGDVIDVALMPPFGEDGAYSLTVRILRGR